MGVIVKPIITEKMTDKGENLNQFGFIVDNTANKLQIKNEVEEFVWCSGTFCKHYELFR